MRLSSHGAWKEVNDRMLINNHQNETYKIA